MKNKYFYAYTVTEDLFHAALEHLDLFEKAKRDDIIMGMMPAPQQSALLRGQPAPPILIFKILAHVPEEEVEAFREHCKTFGKEASALQVVPEGAIPKNVLKGKFPPEVH